MELLNKASKMLPSKDTSSAGKHSISVNPSTTGSSLHCAVRGCIFSRADTVTQQVRFFSSPQCENLRRSWKIACGYIVENTFTVCDRHFAPSDFIRRYDILKLEAIPSLHLDPLGDKVKLTSPPVKESRPSAVCAVRTCIYSRPGSAPNHIRFFPAPPYDDDLRSYWKKACGYSNGSLFTVCERHFTHEDFIKRYNTLKRKAVPSLHLDPADTGSSGKRRRESTSDEDPQTETEGRHIKFTSDTHLEQDLDTLDEMTRAPFIKTEQEYIDMSPRHCEGFDDNDDFHTEFHEILPDISPRSNSYSRTCVDPLLETKPAVAVISHTNEAITIEPLANDYSDDGSNPSKILHIKEENERSDEGNEFSPPRLESGWRGTESCEQSHDWDPRDLDDLQTESPRVVKPVVDQESSSSAGSSTGSLFEARESSSESDSEGVAPVFTQKRLNLTEDPTDSSTKVCVVRGCVNARSGSIQPFIRLYPSPRFKPDLYAWNTACGYHPCEFRDSFVVCGRHFKSTDFRIKDGALKHRIIPSLHLQPAVQGHETEISETPADRENPLPACAVRSCTYSRVTRLPSHVVLYSAPELKSVRDMWKYHCGYRPHEISDSFFVCYRHFSPTDFQKRDGMLKLKAVPTLHSDSPELEES